MQQNRPFRERAEPQYPEAARQQHIQGPVVLEAKVGKDGTVQQLTVILPYTQRAVLDGEIVCLDRKGRPQFKDLLFRRGVPCFFAFDLLYDGKDRRRDALVDRKLELRRMIGRFSGTSRLQYADHIEETGTELFRHVCKLDLAGIVAKPNN